MKYQGKITDPKDLVTKEYVDTGLSGKQNTLTFDDVPTAGSSNPVKSSGIKSAIVNVENDLTTIHQTSPTCTETNGIAAGVFFYLDNELVVAKTAIANGATFTNGTNYESPTAGGLNALKSAMYPSNKQSFTSNNYTVSYVITGFVVSISVTRNENISTMYDGFLTTPIPFKVKTVSGAFSLYSTTFGAHAYVTASGTIHVRHPANSGWFCSYFTAIIDPT